MTVKTLGWIYWMEARDRMPEIWGAWRWRMSDADQAMVNSLRRGKVSVRLSPALRSAYPQAGAYPADSLLWWHGKAIPLSDLVAGLLRLDFHWRPIRAEYEVTVWGEGLSLGGGYQSQPITVQNTALVHGAELAWDEFRDDLIRYELPAGQTHSATPHRAPAQERIARKYPGGIAGITDKEVARSAGTSSRSARRARKINGQLC